MLQNTSFAIHPGNNNKENKRVLKDIGRVKDVQSDDGVVTFCCEGGTVHIQFYHEEVVRVTYARNNVVPLPTQAVTQQSKKGLFTFEHTEHMWKMQTEKLIVEGNMSPFRINISNTNGESLLAESDKGLAYNFQGDLVNFKQAHDQDRYYGFGEKTGFLDKKGEKMTMWNTDVYAPHNPETDPLYQSIPFFLTLRESLAFGLFFDNPGKTHFNMKEDKGSYYFHNETGALDYYVFAGPTLKDAIQQYTWLTGRMPLPPKWAIGYHQSRFSYETEAEVMEVVDKFEEKNIPLDAIYLDIHYMDGYRVFTFDEGRFPNPKKMVETLKTKGIHVVPIVDPGVKEDPNYPVYQEGMRKNKFSKFLDGSVFYGNVWPGKSAFPDFTSETVGRWWGNLHQYYTDIGIEGIWNDMNEPAVFNETMTMDLKVVHDNEGNPKTHNELHNLYGFLMGKATFEGMKKNLDSKRTFLVTRAGYSGIQRYAAVWTGDNRSFWEHLQLAVPMCMNLGMSGVAFCGSDIGGFAHDTNGQLLARWTQFGAFTPFFRNHSAADTIRQEPWVFGEQTEIIVKKYIQLRYQWFPEFYKWFYEAHKTGLPVMRPLVLEYPNDKETHHLFDQFLIGENTIVAPIMTPDTKHRVVYLPEGKWINYWTEDVFDGNRHHLVYADFDIIPVFIKQGSAIAHGSIKANTKQQETDWQLHVYPSNEDKVTYEAYDDNGETTSYEEGDYELYRIQVKLSESMIELVSNVEGTFRPSMDQRSIVIHSDVTYEKAIYNGVDVTSSMTIENGCTVVDLSI
ncbi:glycoside hydrolase family 31 protein [Salipaludibacillus daqingensis]|uniref:glycoside hydrolase family 31 protein n=1 Tax=Salipaludibacillus daqingensis TaxID=3041001 RepID=UPI0024768DE8|nr:TIM-barrel domain-containing protein [Salipaludibacillus daqingensis]